MSLLKKIKTVLYPREIIMQRTAFIPWFHCFLFNWPNIPIKNDDHTMPEKVQQESDNKPCDKRRNGFEFFIVIKFFFRRDEKS